jgi:hypothetical protein
MISDEMDDLTKKVLLGLAIFFAGLIGIVVVVALLQGRLDPAGTATLLGGIFTGIIGGLVLRRGGGSSGPDK